jgi:hypothetical protein
VTLGGLRHASALRTSVRTASLAEIVEPHVVSALGSESARTPWRWCRRVHVLTEALLGERACAHPWANADEIIDLPVKAAVVAKAPGTVVHLTGDRRNSAASHRLCRQARGDQASGPPRRGTLVRSCPMDCCQ